MKRLLRLAAAVLLGTVAALALLVGGALAILRTHAGSDWVRRLALPRVNAAIAGTLEVARFQFSGDRLTLEGVVLRDPGGVAVAQVKAVDLTFSPLALFHERVEVRRALIDGPALVLRQDQAGTNVGRALAPRHPTSASPPSAGGGSGRSLVFELGELRVRGGSVDVRQTGTDAPARVFRARALTIDGHGRYATGSRAFTGALDLRAEAQAPLRAPLSVQASADGQGAGLDATLSASLGDSALAATAQGREGGHLAVRWSRLHVTPDVVRAFVPAARLIVPVDVSGHAARDGARVSFVIDARGAAWRVDARGAIDTASGRARDVSISASDIDLGATIAGLPRSRLSLKLDADGGGTTFRDLDGHLDLEIPAGTLDGISVAPSSIRLTATKGHVAVHALRLTLPGLVATGQGAVSPDQLALAVALRVTDLRRLTHAAAAFVPGVPSVGGAGTVAATLSGTPAAPGLAVTAAFPTLALAANQVTDLRLTARVPDTNVPLVGEIRLRMAGALVNGHALRGVVANLRSTPPRLSGDLRVADGAPVAFDVEGRWAQNHQALELRHLRFRYPQAAWWLTRPARLLFAGKHLAVSGLDLTSGDQRLAVDLDKRGPRVHGAVRAVRFDLARLPALLIPPGQIVTGRLDANVGLDGTVNAPEVSADVRLRDGRVGRYRDLSLALEGDYRQGRAVGSLDAGGLGTSVHARFDTATAWPITSVHGPLALDLVVPETEIGSVLSALNAHPPRPITGRLALALHLSGTVAAPALQMDTTGRALVVDGQSVGDVALHVQGSPRAPLSLAVVFGRDAPGAAATVGLPSSSPGLVPAPSAAPTTGGALPPAATTGGSPPGAPATGGIATGSLSVQTGLSLAALAAHPPTTRELARAHIEVVGELRHIPLATLSRLARTPSPWNGTAALRVSAAGTALTPEGALGLQLSGASGPGFPSTDVRLDARAGAHETRFAVRLARAGRPLGWASMIWRLSAAALRDRSAIIRAPLELTAGVGPLLLRRSGVPGGVGPTGSDELTASLQALLSVRGSVGKPEVVATASVRDTRLGQQPLGTADATLSYIAGRAAAEAWLRSASGGALHLKGRATADLGYPQVTRLDAGAVPFDVTLSGERFDLGWLSGLNRTVRQVGGQLATTITAEGTMRAPHIKGQLEWTHGTLMLTSLGSYHDAHLKAHADQRGLWIDDLRLASGDGDAHLTASASRAQTIGAYTVEASTSLRRFPVYGQGQALATISVDSHVTGTASAQSVRAVAKISEAHAELKDVKQKKLQDQQRPGDIVLMDGDRPADAAEAKRLAGWKGTPVREEEAEGEPVVPRSASPPFALRLDVDAPRNLWVHGEEASLELGLGPDFHVESAGVVAVYGQVLVRRGRIDVLGRRFDLQAGSMVQFTGSPDRPRLDVKAKHFNETEKITVLLTATGPLDKLTIAVSSPERPDLTEGQLYTMIVTGRLQLGGNGAGSTSVSGEAASLVGGLVASQLQKTLAGKLPLDVLTLQAGDGGLTGSRLEAGTYLTSKLYAGYVGRVGANPALLQNRNAVHVEYQLSRRWSFDGEYGDIGTGTADLLWTKNY